MCKKIACLGSVVVWLNLFAGIFPASAQDFFRGKVVRIVVGFSAGGGFDTYSRAIARHWGKHIPGNPTIIVENMPGASSLVAANHVYKIAKPDGLTVGNFHGNQILNQVLGYPGIAFDAKGFEWLGVPVQDHNACVLTKKSGIASLEQWFGSKKPVKLGGVSRGDSTYNTTVILREALGLPIQMVSGYKGSSDIRLAAESGEVAGGCWAWESIKVTWSSALAAGDVLVLLQATPEPHPDLVNVPNAIELAKANEARELIRAGIHIPAAITRPYALPPNTPKDRVQIFRKAFLETLKDPEFLAEAKKSNLDINPLPGEEVEKMILDLFKLEAAVLNRLREILS